MGTTETAEEDVAWAAARDFAMRWAEPKGDPYRQLHLGWASEALELARECAELRSRASAKGLDHALLLVSAIDQSTKP